MSKIYKSLLTLAVLSVILLCLSGCNKHIREIKLDKPELYVTHGETFTIKATVLPEDISYEEIDKIKWTVQSGKLTRKREQTDGNLSRTYIASEVGDAVVKISSGSDEWVYTECKIKILENEDDIAEREKREEEERIAAEKRAEEERIAAEKRAEEARKAQEEAERAKKKAKADELAIPCAKQILGESLKDPYPIYKNEEIVKSDSYMRYIVKITCNARNSFGGYVGDQTYMIALRITDVNKETFTYNRVTSIMDEETINLYSLYEETEYENFFFNDEWDKAPQQ